MTEQEKRNCEGLMYLTWDMFDSPDQPGSGYKFMEREPVLALDRAIHLQKRKMFTEILIGYVSPHQARKLSLSMNDSHRIGKAITLRSACPKKRIDLIEGLVLQGIKRIAVDKREEKVYFDTDDQKQRGLFIWNL